MTNSILRYVSIGLTAAMASIAWAETVYMFSARDGAAYFSSAPAAPRYTTYNTLEKRVGRQLPVPADFEQSALDDFGFSNKPRFDLLVNEVARGYQLESALLHAVVSVESRYNPSALSPAGAIGLMQLMPATAKRYGVDNALDPEQNLRGGAKYLRDLLSMFGSDVKLALAAYHAGENSVARYKNSIPPFKTTIEFVSRVLEQYHKYRGTAP